jgi:hypothetical protein
MLNSWELLSMVLCKHMQSLPSSCQFFDVALDAEPVQRVDDARVGLVIIAKLLEFLRYKKVDPGSRVEAGKYIDLAE